MPSLQFFLVLNSLILFLFSHLTLKAFLAHLRITVIVLMGAFQSFGPPIVKAFVAPIVVAQATQKASAGSCLQIRVQLTQRPFTVPLQFPVIIGCRSHCQVDQLHNYRSHHVIPPSLIIVFVALAVLLPHSLLFPRASLGVSRRRISWTTRHRCHLGRSRRRSRNHRVSPPSVSLLLLFLAFHQFLRLCTWLGLRKPQLKQLLHHLPLRLLWHFVLWILILLCPMEPSVL